MIYVAAAIVILTLVAMASGKVPPVLALAAAISVAAILGIAEPSQLFAGLSNGGVITVAAMLVIAKGVIHTGVVTRVAWRLLSSVTTASQTLGRLILPVGAASAMMNTTPIVAMLIPAVKELQQTRGIPARQVLLPIAHVTTLAGSTTLVGTSSNLLIAGIASGSGVEVGMFSFAIIALPVAIVGWAWLLFASPRAFKASDDAEEKEMTWRVEIPVSAKANGVGRRAGDLGVATTQEFRLLGIRREMAMLEPEEPIAAGDTMVFQATEKGVTALWGSPRFGLAEQRLYAASVAPGEPGTINDLESHGKVDVVAAQTEDQLHEARVNAGDTIYLTSDNPKSMYEHSDIGLWQDAAGKAPQVGRTYIALSILAGVIVAATFGLAAVEIAALTGAVLMVVTGVLSPRAAARALDWNVLFILAGSVGLGAIVVESGIADKISDAITAISAGSLIAVVITLAVSTALLTNITTNAAAASILTPVGLTLALDLGANPVMILALIGTCISFTFINPFSHQSNLMVMQPGRYSMKSFVKFGIPLVAVSLVSVIAVSYAVLM
ncbi:MAG: SLC13 family permease [Actinobacteria bacterium]|jgi:di/tricarboxylate transporter|nr:SLC13 family permease [Micrococcales bacterium]MCB0903269.1 SLC13 family permease [Actinomycetota bacterium]MCO5299698.1 SLC13 family permease [Candidatus Nanopelagicales bacterium]MCB9428401.1 SLC13 family permease [Actinomycetota bacterium]HPE11611.1 SLC13 family permease [Actinomycetota bacterium]